MLSGDQRLDGRRRQMDDPEHGQREAHAVRGGERGDREGELPPSAHQENEREDEEEVVGPAQDVLDAERSVAAKDRGQRETAVHAWHRDRLAAAPEHAGRHVAVGPPDAQQDVDVAAGDPGDGDRSRRAARPSRSRRGTSSEHRDRPRAP